MRNILFTLLLSVAGTQMGYAKSDHTVTVRKQMSRMDIDYERGEALSLLNEIREAMGMNTLTQNDRLEMAAQAHADYLVKNRVTSHSEIQGFPGFTGRTPAERAFHAGYLSSRVIENLSTKNANAQSSIDGLFSAIYHRFGFLDVGIDEAGVGVSQDSRVYEETAFVYLMGNSHLNALCRQKPFNGYGRYVYGVCRDKEHRIAEKRFLKAQESNKWLNPKIILYPYDGQQDVPPAFYGEIPDPLPDFDVSGFPVSVTFNDYFFKEVEVLSFKLYRGDDKAVNFVRVLSHKSDPHGRFSKYQYALFPLKRLEYDTDYRAEIVYRSKGKTKRRSWEFHTRKVHETMFVIRKKKATISIEKGKSYLLYLVPLDGHDVIKSVTFPEQLDLTFSDNNTLRITLMSGDLKKFDIKSGRRTIHVKVK